MFSWSTATFDKLLDKATSHLLLEPEWPAILQICDCIRQGDVQPKYAVNAIKKRLYGTRNPHVMLFALQVLESCVKNCGSVVHNEIASKQFMEELRELVKVNTNDSVREKILELVQTWAYAFRNDPNYRAVQDTLNLMKVEGYKFPVLKESDAMFSADQAPEWAEGDCCHRCRVQFNLVQRKHHCRNCGQIFCQKCSSQSAPIPRFGIEKEVRVCEACYEKLSKPVANPQKSSSSEQSSPYTSSSGGGSGSASTGTPGGKTEQELQEEEELQLAIALSKSEAETKERSKSWSATTPVNNSKPSSTSVSSETSPEPKKDDFGETDPELARYFNRPYWEQRQQESDTHLPRHNSPIPSAPLSAPQTTVYSPVKSLEIQNGEVDELDEFLSSLRTTVEIFINRMKSNSSRGRHIGNDSYVQSLFLNISNMHSQLVHHIQEHDDLRAHYEGLQDKLAQVRDARAALDALREEHAEKLRREAEEAERLRQIQMAQKLDIMRKKKQEYLQYQHQLALQKMQEQERELQLRQEMQKQQYMTQIGGFPPGPPQGYPMAPPPGHGPPGGNSPAHVNHYGPGQYPPPPGSSAGAPVPSGAPIVTGAHGVPPTQAPPHFPLPGSDYSSFNMQAMANSLPPTSQGPPPPGSTPQPMPPNSGPVPPPTSMGPQPPMGHIPGAGPVPQGIMTSAPQTSLPGGPPSMPVMSGQDLPQEVQQRPLEASLISFD